jgi:hypothetical protein
MKNLATTLVAVLSVASGDFVSARLMKDWTYEELFSKSDFVVIAEPISGTHEYGRANQPGEHRAAITRDRSCDRLQNAPCPKGSEARSLCHSPLSLAEERCRTHQRSRVSGVQPRTNRASCVFTFPRARAAMAGSRPLMAKPIQAYFP